MKQNTNIFITIGLAVLVFGQWQAVQGTDDDFSLKFVKNKNDELEQLRNSLVAQQNKAGQRFYANSIKDLLSQINSFMTGLTGVNKNNKTKNFSKEYFLETAKTLLIMINLINFIKKHRILKKTDHYEAQFSKLKTDLYNRYEVRVNEHDKISVKYYHEPKFWFFEQSGFYYSEFMSDPLGGSSPTVYEIKVAREAQEKKAEKAVTVDDIAGPGWKIGKKELSLQQALAAQAGLMLAAVMLKHSFETGGIMGIGEIKSMVKEEIQGVIKSGKSITEAAKSAVGKIMRIVKGETGVERILRTISEEAKEKAELDTFLEKGTDKIPFLGIEEQAAIEKKIVQEKLANWETARAAVRAAREALVED